MRRASSRIRKESVQVDAPEVVNSGGANKKKRPRQGQGSGHQAKRGPKTKEYLSAQLHENVRFCFTPSQVLHVLSPIHKFLRISGDSVTMTA